MKLLDVLLLNLTVADREICYDDIGCFTNAYPWSQQGRILCILVNLPNYMIN